MFVLSSRTILFFAVFIELCESYKMISMISMFYFGSYNK